MMSGFENWPMASLNVSAGSVRPTPLTIPTVIVPTSPKGLPIAITRCPTLT